MAKSDNRHSVGVDNAWFGDCGTDADVKRLCVESSAKFGYTMSNEKVSEN
jgi:hypothetical protein